MGVKVKPAVGGEYNIVLQVTPFPLRLRLRYKGCASLAAIAVPLNTALYLAVKYLLLSLPILLALSAGNAHACKRKIGSNEPIRCPYSLYVAGVAGDYATENSGVWFSSGIPGSDADTPKKIAEKCENLESLENLATEEMNQEHSYSAFSFAVSEELRGEDFPSLIAGIRHEDSWRYIMYSGAHKRVGKIEAAKVESYCGGEI